MAPNTVAVVVYDGISPFHLSIPCTLFGEDFGNPGVPEPRIRLCALRPGPLRTSIGFTVDVPNTLRSLNGCALVVVPGWPPTLPAAPPALVAALRRAHEGGSVVVGLCLGAFVLAQAGLLDGHSATTHWLHADELSARHPKIRVDPNVLYLDEGDVVTSAGAAAALDCCLHLYRRFHGPAAAVHVAKRLVVAPHRQGGQAQFIEHPLPRSPEEDAFSKSLDWAIGHLNETLSLDTLAERAHVSRRHFSRRFRQAMGTSPKAWILAQRLAQAQNLLQGGHMPIQEVAEACGFGSTSTLRQQFNKAFRVSPADYRRAFQ